MSVKRSCAAEEKKDDDDRPQKRGRNAGERDANEEEEDDDDDAGEDGRAIDGKEEEEDDAGEDGRAIDGEEEEEEEEVEGEVRALLNTILTHVGQTHGATPAELAHLTAIGVVLCYRNNPELFTFLHGPTIPRTQYNQLIERLLLSVAQFAARLVLAQ
jgi:hypothetical protein